MTNPQTFKPSNPQILEDIIFLDRIKRYPKLKGRMESILNLVENKEGDLIKANDAEKRARDELRKLGNEVWHDWALNRIAPSTEALRVKETNLESNGKTNGSGIQHLVRLKSMSRFFGNRENSSGRV